MKGPVNSTLSFSQWKVSNPDTGAGSFCRVYYRTSTSYRSGTRQHHARDPLPYLMSMGSIDFTAGKTQTCDAANDIARTTLTDSRWINVNNLVSNKAAANFVENAQGVAQASLGETLGEWDTSLKLMCSRLRQLAKAAHELRRGRPRNAARALHLTRDAWSPRRVEQAKTFGNAWLEFHLGWAPMMSDIYNACKAFEKQPFPELCRGYGRSREYYEIVSQFSTSKTTKKVHYEVGYAVGGYVRVTNPNVALLAQLGLANPASVAWSLATFSFVFDWFVDLGTLIGLYDGLLGCETDRPWTTTLRLSRAVTESYNRSNASAPWELLTLINAHGGYCNRTLGLPPAHLTYINAPRFSWQRGATAVALLLQQLR